MSYLLTEIAMEMLGYRYYDIHGEEQPLNLDRDRREEMGERQNLEDFLGIKWDNELKEFVQVREVETESQYTEKTQSVTEGTIINDNNIPLEAEVEILRQQIVQKYHPQLRVGYDELINSDKFKEYLSSEKHLMKAEMERLTLFYEQLEKHFNSSSKGAAADDKESELEAEKS